MPDFPELRALERLAQRMKDLGEVQDNGPIRFKGQDYPLLSFHFGSNSRTAPTLIFIGGIHGLEQIGTQVLISYLESFMNLLRWDTSLQHSLKKIKIIFYPLANPVGMKEKTRSNGQGVDLMRNSPVEASFGVMPLVGGHHLSPKLPWYRGTGELEQENEILCRLIRKHCFGSRASIVLDVHSGFGLKDSIWFPFASSEEPFPEAGRILAMSQLLERSYSHHTYVLEPQFHAYKTHGDIWDYLYHENKKQGKERAFIPLTLEMGSWTWVRKNPKQIFSRLGLFNPILPHRIKRTERRHFILFNFLVKLIASPEVWAEWPEPKIKTWQRRALMHWYQAKS